MRLGIIGDPIGHSLSPVMQEAALKALGIAGSYQILAVPAADLAAAFQEVRRSYRGVNVTIPHKIAALTLVDHLSYEARSIGALNTVVNDQGFLTGYNTDAAGFTWAWQQAGIELAGKRVLVLGAGGAARAVAYAVQQAGGVLWIANRNQQRGLELAQSFGGQMVELARAREAQIIVNATSVGMTDPRSSPLPEEYFPSAGAVMDLVYRPLETRFLKLARQKGILAIDGLAMLVGQGAAAFELWTGRKAPVAAMSSALERAMGYHSNE